MSKLSVNQKDLKSKINYHLINDKVYYYTLCKKEQDNITIMSNWRLLIFNQDQGTLYYVNQPDKIPFIAESVLMKPKKQVAYVNTSVVKNQFKTKILLVSYNKKAQKDKLTAGQWKFQMDTQTLAKDWVAMIKNNKEEKTAKALGISKQNASNLNDLLAYTMVGNQKIQQPLAQNRQNPTITQSQKVTQQNKKQLDKNQLNKSVISKNESNVLSNSNINKTQPLQNKNNQASQQWNRTSYKKLDPVLPSKSETEKSVFNYAMNNSRNSGVNVTVAEQKKIENTNLNRTSVEYHKYEVPESTSPYLKPNTQRPKISQIKPVQIKPQGRQSSQRPPSNIGNSNLIKPSPINNQPQIRKSVISNPSQRSKAPKNAGEIDWNRKFIEQHNQKTIQQFSQFALQTWLQIGPERLSLRADSQSKDQQNQPQCLQRNKIIFCMAQHGTRAASKLQKQFKNYHFILESIRQNMFINVPLSCIIEYLGIVCLAKAKLPQSSQIIQNLTENNPAGIQVGQQLRTLQLFTKISNESIKKSSTIYDVSKQYGNAGASMRLYIDDLIEYLPVNPESVLSQQFQVRPKLILDNFSKTINPKHEQSKQQIQQHLNIQLSQLSDVLSDCKTMIINYSNLKQLMHQYGLNTKMLPKLYLLTKSRLVKKFIHTAMFARVIKSDILRTVSDFRQTKQTQHLPQIIQESIRIFCENKTNQQDQVFKNTAQQFKKRYRLAFNMHQIQPGFLISTLMTMISAQYDLSKIDRTKRFFQDAHIINKGFIVQLKPKLKIYDNYSTQKTERVMNLCRSNRNQIQQIKNIIQLRPQNINNNLNRDDKYKSYAYLSNYISPFHAQYSQLHKQIYDIVNAQPPSLASHQITLNYVNFCMDAQKMEEYKKTIQNAIDILSYWLGQDHPLLCDIFQSLSDYYGRKGSHEDSINFMKQALTTCIRSTGTHTQKSGSQYFKLAQKQLKYGQKQDAIDNFYKAKLNMEALPQQSAQYTILLMRLANIQLSQGNADKCIKLAIKSIKSTQNKNISDTITVKIYQILCRAYQISNSKQQINNLAHLTAKIFNTTNNHYTYDQMIRISLIGFIMTLLPLKQQKLQEYLQLLSKNIQPTPNGKDAIHRLMAYSSETIIMEKVSKYLNNIQKYLSDIKSGRNLSAQSKQVKWLFQLIIGAVGIDFIEGVLNQAKYW